MADFNAGQVFLYKYLWARQFDRGEETGRKDRQVCVQIIIASAASQSLTLLFPVTSQRPQEAAQALEVPAIEARRTGLREPARVIVEEWSEDRLDTSPFLADPNP